MSDKAFLPFVDDSGVFTIGGLQVENGFDTVAVFGDLRLFRDIRSKRAAEALAKVLLEVASSIGEDAPEEAAEVVRAPEEVSNPFG